MTDSPTPEPGPVDPDVELASAHLDGEAGPDERARAEDPAVQAQLAAFAGLADRVRDVPPPPAGLLDDQIARAMGAFDEDGTVVAIGRDRTPWWQRIPLGAVAAALVVVALVGIASLAGQGSDDDEADTATAALDSADESAEGGGTADDSFAAADAPQEEAAIESSSGLAGDGERPAYESYDELAAGIRDELGTTGRTSAAPPPDGRQPTTTAPGGGGGGGGGEAEQDAASTDPCGAVGVLGIDPAAVLLVRPAIVIPDPVTVVVHDAEDGRRLAVVDDGTCEVVLDRLL